MRSALDEEGVGGEASAEGVAGAAVVGFRLHPAVSFSLLGKLYSEPTSIDVIDNSSAALHQLCAQLKNMRGHHARITFIYRWLTELVSPSQAVPMSLQQALDAIDKRSTPGELSELVELSQRQIERQFQRWMGMTPKDYQRILRVKKTLTYLKANPESELVDLALREGFTDQAHMTREFKHIAKITPKQYCKQVVRDRLALAEMV